MATRAEWFRYEKERSGPKKEKQAWKEPRHDPETPHNESTHAAKSAAYALEAATGQRPSRKSSRKAANRQKTDVQYRMKAQTAEARPAAKPRAPMH
ncbi:MAG TPA: hypothetical protein VFP50_00790 [Anaeromyxobacteraceae bacterium]|nr:hypothetical protein [Anaeromyxobacteraceae bacterium]